MAERLYRKIAVASLLYMLALTIRLPLIIHEDWSFGFTAVMIVVVGLGVFGQYFFGVPYQLLVTADQSGYIQISAKIATIVANTLLVVVLVRMGVSLPLVMFSSGFLLMCRAYTLRIYVKKRYGIKTPIGRGDEKLLEQRWSGVGHSIARFIHRKTDILVITVFLNLQMVTVYSVYSLVSNSLNMLVTTVTTPIQAAFGDIIAKEENVRLQMIFEVFSTVIHMLSIVLFSSAYILILPFMAIYTRHFSDAIYIQPLFALLLLTSELIYCLRLPYDTIIASAGKYKETRNAAFMEAALNLAISVILVLFWGIIGVAVGTMLSVTYRYISYTIYLHKNVLHIKYSYAVRRIFFSALNLLAILAVASRSASQHASDSMLEWCVFATLVTIEAAGITLVVHWIFYKTEVVCLFLNLRRLKNARKCV